jgi:N-acetylmuramoyl-L-alanine amidase
MKGLLDQNETLQIEALQGLVKAASSLGVDSERYKNALKSLRPDRFSRQKKISKRKISPKNGTIETHPLPISGKKAKLVSLHLDADRLILEFSLPISESSVRHFVFKKKDSILYVYDIKPARVPFSIKRYKGGGFKEIRIAQYDPKKMRVVIETFRSYTPQLKIRAQKVAITLPEPAAGRVVSKSGYDTKKKLHPQLLSLQNAPVVASKKASGLKTYIVVIDPGHGGKDVGAVGYKRRKEKDVVLAVAKDLKKVLKKRGFKVYLTRERDKFIPLKQRTHFANRKNADFFISIHANAAAKKSGYLKNKGIETYFLSWKRSGRAKQVAELENRADLSDKNFYTKNTYLDVMNREKIIESNKLAIDLQRQILSSVKRKYKDVVDNGVRDGPFWVLVGAQMPAVLIEIGYITHPKEAKRLFNPYYRKLLAEGIANGIESYIYHKKQ